MNLNIKIHSFFDSKLKGSKFRDSLDENNHFKTQCFYHITLFYVILFFLLPIKEL